MINRKNDVILWLYQLNNGKSLGVLFKKLREAKPQPFEPALGNASEGKWKNVGLDDYALFFSVNNTHFRIWKWDFLLWSSSLGKKKKTI